MKRYFIFVKSFVWILHLSNKKFMSFVIPSMKLFLHMLKK